MNTELEITGMAKEVQTLAEVTMNGYLIGLKPDLKGPKEAFGNDEAAFINESQFRWRNRTFMTGALVIFVVEPKPRGVC